MGYNVFASMKSLTTMVGVVGNMEYYYLFIL